MQMEGRRLRGRYEIVSRLGGGGMAVVYKARDISLNRYVAVKVLSDSLSNDSEFIRRFSREAQATASLSHPNVVNVYDVGQDGYIHFMVMELVEGPTLKQYILDRGPLSVLEATQIAIQICDGLAHAHDHHIVHRDIKPHNILLKMNRTRYGEKIVAKVTDFGIARAASSSTITQQGSVMGSVHYFSPEQAKGNQVDEKSDIYSLGIVLYEMLTCELPFDGESAVAIVLKQIQEQPVDPRKLNRDIPDDVARLILKAMAKDPNERYSSVREMKRELEIAQQWASTKLNPVFEIVRDEEENGPDRMRKRDDNHKKPPFDPSPNGKGERIDRWSNGDHQTKISQETKDKLKKDFSRVEVDPNKTIIQKTMYYIKEQMSLWQKVLFGAFTFFVIVALSIFLFTTVWDWFSKPSDDRDSSSGTAAAEKTVKIPNLRDVDYDEAEKELQNLGLEVKKRFLRDSDVKPGRVIKSDPEEGKEVEVGTVVDVFVSLSEGVKVGNYLGLFESSATRPLPKEGDGYKIKKYYCSTSQGVSQGQVYAQEPAPGESIEKDGTVQVWVEPGNGYCQKKVPKSAERLSHNQISRLLVSADSWHRESADFVFYLRSYIIKRDNGSKKEVV